MLFSGERLAIDQEPAGPANDYPARKKEPERAREKEGEGEGEGERGRLKGSQVYTRRGGVVEWKRTNILLVT